METECLRELAKYRTPGVEVYGTNSSPPVSFLKDFGSKWTEVQLVGSSMVRNLLWCMCNQKERKQAVIDEQLAIAAEQEERERIQRELGKGLNPPESDSAKLQAFKLWIECVFSY